MLITKRLTLVFLFSIFIIKCNSQIKVSGRVISTDGDGIHLVNVVIPKLSIGTITNKDGDFELLIPNKYVKEKVQISCIGYKTILVSIDSLMKSKHPKNIVINKHLFSLDEIIIKKQDILKDAKQIFTNAIDSLPNRLDNKPNIGKYFYRQTHRDDSVINRIIEAAVSIYDPGINHNISSCKINIDELQSSLDNRVIDYRLLLEHYRYLLKKRKLNPKIKSSDSYKDPIIQKKLLAFFDKERSLLSSFFIKTNMIRGVQYIKRKKSLRINPYLKNGGPIITNSFIKEHLFKLDTILLYNEYPIYKIKILPNRKYPKIKYQEHSIIPIGTAYIRIKDFALLGLDYGYIDNPNHKYYDGKPSFYYRFKIQFKDLNNKLYLSYLYSMKSDYNLRFYTKKRNGNQRLIQEIMNTEIIHNHNSINKKLNTLRWKGDQYEKLPYKKEFWDKYSTMLPTREEQLLKDNLIEEIKKKKE